MIYKGAVSHVVPLGSAFVTGATPTRDRIGSEIRYLSDSTT